MKYVERHAPCTNCNKRPDITKLLGTQHWQNTRKFFVMLSLQTPCRDWDKIQFCRKDWLLGVDPRKFLQATSNVLYKKVIECAELHLLIFVSTINNYLDVFLGEKTATWAREVLESGERRPVRFHRLDLPSSICRSRGKSYHGIFQNGDLR